MVSEAGWLITRIAGNVSGFEGLFWLNHFVGYHCSVQTFSIVAAAWFQGVISAVTLPHAVVAETIGFRHQRCDAVVAVQLAGREILLAVGR